jgi:hypothetical protein
MSTCSQGGRSNTSRDLNIKAKHTVALVGAICITVGEKAERDTARRILKGPSGAPASGLHPTISATRISAIFRVSLMADLRASSGTAQNAVRPLVIC